MDGCAAPVSLKKGVFTIGAVDNLDHNPSSTIAFSSFHGTGVTGTAEQGGREARAPNICNIIKS